MTLGLPLASHENLIDSNSLMRRCGVTVIATSGETEKDDRKNIGVTIPRKCSFIFMTLFIYLVGLPSAMYERPGKNERSVLNQMFLLLFRCFSTFSGDFHKKRHFSQKAQVLFMKSVK